VDGSFLHPAYIEETHKALRNIQYLKQGRKACNVIIPGLESQDYSGMLNGVSGDVPSRDEILRSIGREGVTALMIAGNLPGGAYLKKVKFLVQLNMFKTPMSEFADVFLPVSGLLENRGHFRALDGKIKTVRKALNAPENARTMQRIFADLAGLMGYVGFPSRPTAVWKEFRTNGGKKAGKPPKAMLAYQPLDPSVHPGKAGRFKQFQDGSPDFQYRGNDLSGLVPDLDIVLESMQKNYP
jgi:hypothetical protein